MPKLTSSISINAQPEKVYDYAASPKNGPMFLPNLNENTNISNDQTQVGQSWDWRFNMAGVDLKGHSEVTEADRPNKWSLKTTGGAESQWIYTFTSENGGTHIVLDVEYQVPQDVLAKVGAPVIEKLNQTNADQALQNLKTILEAE